MKRGYRFTHTVIVLLTVFFTVIVAVGVNGQENVEPKKIDRDKIDLNQATVEELKVLQGIGPVAARSIVAHRRVVGSFRSIEELMAVPGIGRKTFAKIRDRVTIGERQSAAGDPSDDGS